jgi:opacity protein-like surface antigen
MKRRHSALLLVTAAAGVLIAIFAAAPALAGDLYVSGRLGVSGATGDTGGSTIFGFSPSGSDSDSSPVWGTALGLEYRLDEPIPSATDSALADWRLRLELEGLGGRDYELRTQGADPFFTEATAWTVMQNLWVDLPLHSAVTSLFGRVPVLEPLSFYAGGGVGLGITDVSTTDNVSSGSETALGVTWQGGTGFSYSFTDLVTFSIGYRYQDLGTIEMDLRDASLANVGRFELDLAAHEITTGLRVRFYPVPFPSFQR